MIVQPISNNDLEAIKDLQPADWPDIIPHIEKYIQSSFCFPLKLMEDKKIIGTGTLIVHGNTAWLAHIIVHPDFRNRGIGFLIVNALLQHSEALKIRTKLLIATKLGEPVYLKAGFRVVSTYRFFTREVPPQVYKPVPEITNIKSEHIPQILKLDAMVSGEQRKELLKDYLNNAKIFLDDGQVKGFYLPDLGEGLIIAEDKIAGLELLKLKCSVKNKVILPEENGTGISFLKENGFVEVLQGKRMILGEDITWQPQNYYSRIGGNLG